MKLLCGLLLLLLLTGCYEMLPPYSPLPTPTTITMSPVPVKVLRQGRACITELTSEPQVFIIESAAEWENLLVQFGTENLSLTVDGADAVAETDFHTERLLLALRMCHDTSNYTLTLDRVIQVSNDRLFVYVEMQDPDRGSYLWPEPGGYYYFASIPWAAENVDTPTLEVIDYTLYLKYGQPVP